MWNYCSLSLSYLSESEFSPSLVCISRQNSWSFWVDGRIQISLLKPGIKCSLCTRMEKIIIFNYFGFPLLVLNPSGCLLNRPRVLGFPTMEQLMSILLAWLTVSGKLWRTKVCLDFGVDSHPVCSRWGFAFIPIKDYPEVIKTHFWTVGVIKLMRCLCTY